MFRSIIKEFKDTYKFRFVIQNFVSTSLKQRYRRSVLGFLWSVLAPLLSYLVIGYIFSLNLRVIGSNFFPYMFAGAIFFSVMSVTINYSVNVFIINEHYIKKIYIPKMVFILNLILTEFTNFFFAFVSLLILGIIFRQIHFSWHFLFIFVPIILAILFLIGISSILGIICIYFRDLHHIIPVIMQALFFLTPIMWTPDLFGEKARQLLYLNPFYYFVEVFRVPLVENRLPDLFFILYMIIFSISVFIIGLLILKKYENRIVFKL